MKFKSSARTFDLIQLVSVSNRRNTENTSMKTQIGNDEKKNKIKKKKWAIALTINHAFSSNGLLLAVEVFRFSLWFRFRLFNVQKFMAQALQLLNNWMNTFKCMPLSLAKKKEILVRSNNKAHFSLHPHQNLNKKNNV